MTTLQINEIQRMVNALKEVKISVLTEALDVLNTAIEAFKFDDPITGLSWVKAFWRLVLNLDYSKYEKEIIDRIKDQEDKEIRYDLQEM